MGKFNQVHTRIRSGVAGLWSRWSGYRGGASVGGGCIASPDMGASWRR